jgi:hypothetical protein
MMLIVLGDFGECGFAMWKLFGGVEMRTDLEVVGRDLVEELGDIVGNKDEGFECGVDFQSG